MSWNNVVLILGLAAIICPTICYISNKHFDYKKKKLDARALENIKNRGQDS